jgi:nucleoside-diphosphate-sugar epimerase
MKYTVLGGRGFIGSHVAGALEKRGHEVWIPPREALLTGRDLGIVIYAIGITADFRQRPFETVDAHVGVLNDVLRACSFTSLLYLSSTRIYGNGQAVANERTPLTVNPTDPGDLYNLTKATGESVALHSGKPCRVARISNVYGEDYASQNFLSDVLRQAAKEGRVTFHTSPKSQKDYIALSDVVTLLLCIAESGRDLVYNVASGTPTSHQQIADVLANQCQIRCDFEASSPTIHNVPISVERVRGEFGFTPRNVLADLPALFNRYKASCERQ